MGLFELDPGWVVVNIVVLLFSLSLHESAHAWTADYLGDPTGRALGRVTLNPLPHIDPLGTILFPLIGLISGIALFGWAKPVPVNPRHLRNPKIGQLWVAAAGPASNVAAAAGFLAALKVLSLWSVGSPSEPAGIVEPLLLMCRVGVFLNLLLAVFNMIPIPPLDGSWVLMGLLPDTFSRWMESVRPYGFLLLIGLLYSGMLNVILRPIWFVLRAVI